MLYRNGKNLALDGSEMKAQALSTVRRYQRRAIGKPTVAELAFMKLISPVCAKTGVRYVKQAIFYVTGGISFRADFVFRDHRLIVEIDGASHSRQMEEDAWRDRVLLEVVGMYTLRLTNEDVTTRYLVARMRVLNALLARPSGRRAELEAYREAFAGDAGYLRQMAGGK